MINSVQEEGEAVSMAFRRKSQRRRSRRRGRQNGLQESNFRAIDVHQLPSVE